MKLTQIKLIVFRVGKKAELQRAAHSGVWLKYAGMAGEFFYKIYLRGIVKSLVDLGADKFGEKDAGGKTGK